MLAFPAIECRSLSFQNSPTVEQEEARAAGRGAVASIEAFNFVACDSDQSGSPSA